MILLDTSGLLAALSPTQRAHQGCASVLSEAQGPLLLSPFVLGELDYLIGKLVGLRGELSFLTEVARGAYDLVSFGASDVDRAREVIEQYADHHIGLTDASLVVLAERYGAHDLLTLDERHFRVLRGANETPFRILPADL